MDTQHIKFKLNSNLTYVLFTKFKYVLKYITQIYLFIYEIIWFVYGLSITKRHDYKKPTRIYKNICL